MKSTVVILASLLVNGCNSFVPSSPQSSKFTIALHAEKQNNVDSMQTTRREALIRGVSAVGAAGLVIAASPNKALAADIEEFALPSYDSSKGSTLMDINSELENINKDTLSKAKSKREYKDTSEQKLEADKLRKAEKDGGSLLDSMVSQSDADKKARVAAEIAESRANRWNTF